MEDIEGRFVGSIVGLAVGDALGYPGEFRTRAQILETFGPEGITEFVGVMDERWPARPIIIGTRHPPGSYSDDTQMTIALAEGLLETQGQDLDARMEAVGRHFVAWSRSEDNDRAPGGTCMTGCENLARGVPWRQANVANSKGCGSAMRVAPIGLLWHDEPEELGRVARASSLLTHGHDAGVEGAAAAARLVGAAARGDAPEAMYHEVMAASAGRSPDFERRMRQLPAMLDREPAEALSSQGLGEAWVAEEAVASALYCVWRHPDDFAAAALEGANTDGDSDSIACIVGGIMGARLGIEGIPERWREQVEDSARLHELGRRLAEAWRARS